MLKQTKLTIFGFILILSATIAWGSSGFIIKDVNLPTLYVNGIRFLGSVIVFLLIFNKKIITMKKETFIHGIKLGVVLFGAYLFQMTGIKYTTASKNIFIATLYCVMAPFMVWIFYKQKPKLYNVISAVLVVVGMGLMFLSKDDATHAPNETLGIILTFTSAIFFGFQLLLNDKYVGRYKEDPIEILTIELLIGGILLFVSSAILELPKNGIEAYKINLEQGISIGYLTLVCTGYAQLAQLIGQKYTTASQSAVILSLEGVFGVFFSVLFGGETLTLILAIGFLCIFTATIISELKVDFAKLLHIRTRELEEIKGENFTSNDENLTSK